MSNLRNELTFGEHLADKIAGFAGILFLWVALNTFILLSSPFDPYPYILLNLVLSALAAIQAPVIIMSQNRQEERDRMNAEHDYRVNLNAEMEIHRLHKKLDHLLIKQGERLLENSENSSGTDGRAGQKNSVRPTVSLPDLRIHSSIYP